MRNNTRYDILDTLRGITIISMCLYHGCWDLVYLFGADIPWYDRMPGYIWQQSICITFILLSGFCFGLGRHPIKRGLQISLCGVLITSVTCIFMPDSSIVFGILTLLGASMLITAFIGALLSRCPMIMASLPLKLILLGTVFFLFVFTKTINRGYVGIPGLIRLIVPASFYSSLFSTFLGFPAPGFFSVDYFSLLPWFFLYFSGYLLYHSICTNGELPIKGVRGIPLLSFLGRNSLFIYMLHQVVIYLFLTIVFKLSI